VNISALNLKRKAIIPHKDNECNWNRSFKHPWLASAAAAVIFGSIYNLLRNQHSPLLSPRNFISREELRQRTMKPSFQLGERFLCITQNFCEPTPSGRASEQPFLTFNLAQVTTFSSHFRARTNFLFNEISESNLLYLRARVCADTCISMQIMQGTTAGRECGTTNVSGKFETFA